MSISLVWLTIPAPKLILSEASCPGVNVTLADAEFPERSLPIMAVKEEVVMVEPGLVIPLTVIYMLETSEIEAKGLLITRMLPFIAQLYPVMLASFTDTSKQTASAMSSVVYSAGNWTVVVLSGDKGVVSHGVVVRESS